MTTEETAETTLNLSKELLETLEHEAKEREVDIGEVLEDWLTDGFYVLYHDADESVVKLKYIDPWKEGQKQVEPATADGETHTTLQTFRRLRDEFPPITAGIEYSKAFTSGGGFTVEIDDSGDPHQQEVKRKIIEFNTNVFQDEVTIGLDSILDIMLDDVFTVGCAAAEIVYKKFEEPGSFNFYDWVEPVTPEAEGDPEFISKKLTDKDWKELGGIVQLKIIDNAVERMKPYRNPKTYKIEYWTIDEADTKLHNKNHPDQTKDVPKLLPWQVLWLSWGRRGSNIKGKSLIRPVAKTAILLEEILKAVGTSFKKWSDRKYFFILGSDKTGRSWPPHKIRTFLNDVKRMTTKGGTAIPVPAGFDIKEIGGEVFEGGTIIDRLISMICGGMRFPRTFLEQGKTQEGDKAWLAWIVTYATHQKLLRRAIEHQLWRRHLYCIYGTTRRIPKQGVPIEKQEEVPIYVPKMSWKSEGKWHVQTKIEELTRILNVANPVGAELKLEVEADIAETLGYRDLNLNNARKVLELYQKLQILENETDLLKAQMIKEAIEEAMKKGIHKEMIPVISGLKAPEPEPEQSKRPPPVPLKRLLGGVSKSIKQPGGDQKGVAKPLGGTRKPRMKGVVQETSEEPVLEFDTYEDLIGTIVRVSEHQMKMEESEMRNKLFAKLLEVLEGVEA